LPKPGDFKMYKSLQIIFVSFSLGLIAQLMRQWPSNRLQVIFCDVGQGDAILIQYGFWQMLVDAGANDQVLDCLSQNMPFWDKTLELVVVTHTDHDHIGGISDVLANYQVQQILLADTGESEGFKKMLTEMKSDKQRLAVVKNAFLGQMISFTSGGKLYLLGPEFGNLSCCECLASEFSETLLSDAEQLGSVTTDSPNERSIILLLKYYQFDLLLMGDASQQNELALIDKGLIDKIEVLKVGHHGSKTSTHESFVKTTLPEKAVISCGYNNKFSHPSPEVLQILLENNAKILRTDELGTIKLETNGYYYWIAN